MFWSVMDCPSVTHGDIMSLVCACILCLHSNNTDCHISCRLLHEGSQSRTHSGGASLLLPADMRDLTSKQPTVPHTTVSQRLRCHLHHMLIGKGWRVIDLLVHIWFLMGEYWKVNDFEKWNTVSLSVVTMLSFLKKQDKIKRKLVLTGTHMTLSFTIFLV